MYYQTAPWYDEDTQYKYCDVPFTNTITLSSPIYGDTDASCYVEVQGSESNPDEIKVKWYVNGDYAGSETCSNNECDDDSGSTWSNTFTLSNSYFSKGDQVYCIGRGYGEDGGNGAYVESSIITISNRVPTWSSISLDEAYAKQGDNIKVTASGEADIDSDTLAMYCCNGDSCTPSNSNHDFCYTTSGTPPYNLYCTGQGLNENEIKTVRCILYDGEGYSDIKSTTYTADNTAPNVNIISPLNQTYNTSSIDFNVSLNEVGSCKYSLNKGVNNITMGTTDNKNFSSTNSSIANGGYIANFYCEDSVENINDTESVSFSVSIGAPLNDTYKFYHKDSSGNTVAWLGDQGNIVLKGKCYSGGNCNNPGDNSLIFRNESDYNLGFINVTGDLCIIKGDCSDESTNCDSPVDGAFIMANSTDYVSYIDGEGDLCLTGTLYQNSEP